MEQIKELTKRLIANSFKELLLQNSFDKITIKMITDHANVIRPTFYNHFHDKYELVEWILKDDILYEARRLSGEASLEEGVRFIISRFYQEREYYKRAFEITGQNGFRETLSGLLADYFDNIAAMNKDCGKGINVPKEFVGRYCSAGMIAVLMSVVEFSEEDNPEDLIEAYKYILSCDFFKL